MGKRSIRKGKNYEREVVNEAKQHGLNAERAYASNGQALGEVKECDVKIEQWRCDLKRRKNIANYLDITDGVDCKIIREDRGESIVLLPLQQFLELIKND